MVYRCLVQRKGREMSLQEKAKDKALKKKLSVATQALRDIDDNLHYAIEASVDPKLCGAAIKTAWSRAKKALARIQEKA